MCKSATCGAVCGVSGEGHGHFSRCSPGSATLLLPNQSDSPGSGRQSAFRWPILLDERAASRSDTPALMLRDRHLISMIALALGPAAIVSMIARLQRVRLFPVLAPLSGTSVSMLASGDLRRRQGHTHTHTSKDRELQTVNSCVLFCFCDL